jgi:hypothetical protein
MLWIIILTGKLIQFAFGLSKIGDYYGNNKTVRKRDDASGYPFFCLRRYRKS